MGKYHILIKTPTKEDYFLAKLNDITFAIKNRSDFITFDLLDFDRIDEMSISQFTKADNSSNFYIHNAKFKHDVRAVVVYNPYSLNETFTFTFSADYNTVISLPSHWLKENYPDIYSLIMKHSESHDYP